MAIIEHEVIINASPDKIYAVSQDYSIRYEWDPFPERIELLHGARDIGIGVKTLVKAKSGLQMEVEFIQIDPPTRAAIMMTKGPIFIESFAGSWVFKAVDNHRTKAKFRYAIKTKKWAIPLVSEYIASVYFKKMIVSRLIGLKTYCEQSTTVM
jgi:hypothetical protein